MHWILNLGAIAIGNIHENIIKFKGCEFLDFRKCYDAKRQLTEMGLFWMRQQEPSMVQFCSKKGRIYGCQACLSKGNKQCNDYSEIKHSVFVLSEELE